MHDVGDFLIYIWGLNGFVIMEIPREFSNIDMGVKNFKHKSIPSRIPLFEILQAQELNQTMVI